MKCKISLQWGEPADDPNGIVKIWNWKENSFNTCHQNKVPIWTILTSKQLYQLLLFETIEIDVEKFNRHFIKIKC